MCLMNDGNTCQQSAGTSISLDVVTDKTNVQHAGLSVNQIYLMQTVFLLQVPAERWDIEAAYSPDVATDKTYVRHAGFLSAVDAFDADAFRCITRGECHVAVNQPRTLVMPTPLALAFWRPARISLTLAALRTKMGNYDFLKHSRAAARQPDLAVLCENMPASSSVCALGLQPLPRDASSVKADRHIRWGKHFTLRICFMQNVGQRGSPDGLARPLAARDDRRFCIGILNATVHNTDASSHMHICITAGCRATRRLSWTRKAACCWRRQPAPLRILPRALQGRRRPRPASMWVSCTWSTSST